MHFYHAWFRRAPRARRVRPQHRSQRAEALSEVDQLGEAHIDWEKVTLCDIVI